MSQDQRFLMLDVDGGFTELHGSMFNISALLGNAMSVYESAPGLCFAVSNTSSARYAEPNLHVSKFARSNTGVIAPFFGSTIIIGGLILTQDHPHLVEIDPTQEQQLRASVAMSRAWLTAHPEQARRGAELSVGLRRLLATRLPQAPRS